MNSVLGATLQIRFSHNCGVNMQENLEIHCVEFVFTINRRPSPILLPHSLVVRVIYDARFVPNKNKSRDNNTQIIKKIR
uniref:Uncharacterized protein n=1 Tax=Rhizophora mucronata TaxID=61149 RepID=A0A2P2QU64_RHIMU